MKIADKFEQIDCRKDEKARRVSNVAPDVAANITPDEIEAGVTLERLESLNVPVLRYGTQLTIHGTLPAFNPNARPGGYRAVFLNKNKSVGVRYSAIDAKKKDWILRACAASGPWHANRTSSGFTIGRSFYVKNEADRDTVRQECLTALRTIPVSLFYGAAFAYCLPYGAGYGCGAEIGAIPESALWPLIEALTGITSPAAIECAERIKQAEQDAKMAAWRAECDARKESALAANEAALHAISGQWIKAEREPVGRVLVKRETSISQYDTEKTGETWHYTLVSRSDGSTDGIGKRHKAVRGFPFSKSLAEGRVFIPTNQCHRA